jgi:hypothetical protein
VFAVSFELFCEGECERGFARAADADVADDDDGNADAMTGQDVAAIQRAAQCDECCEQPTDGQQDEMQRRDAIPVALQAVHFI